MITVSRSPLGLRGLKCIAKNIIADAGLCRSPFGLRGLKFSAALHSTQSLRRSPFGLRGLKLLRRQCQQTHNCVAAHSGRGG